MIEFLRNLLLKLRRHLALTGLVLGLGALGSGVAGLHRWKEYHLHAAHEALGRYAFDEAQHHLDRCLAVPFQDGDLSLLAARTARRRDSYQEAARHLTACQQQKGMTEAVALERVLLAAQQGEIAGVERLLSSHRVADDLKSVLILEALAKGYCLRSWREEALACLNKLLDLQPEYPQALLLRARVRQEMNSSGQVEPEADALRDYEKALSATSSFEAQLGRAGALYRLGRPWDALLQYQQLRPLGQSDAQVLLGLARCRYSLAEVDESRRLLDELLQRHSDHWEGLLERGRLELHAGKSAEAEKWLRRAVDLAPFWEIGALRSLGQCLQSQGKDEDARRYFARLDRKLAELLQVDRLTMQANRNPSNVALRYEIAEKLMRQGRERDGVAALYHVLDQQPRHRSAHAELADYFTRVGQPDVAARHQPDADESTQAR